MATAGTPVVFVHGLWLHAGSWSPWVERFREAGYAPAAPPWPGDSATVEETRKNADRVAGYGIGDVVDHYAAFVEGLGSKPIVIGHSFGGLIVQRLLGEDRAAAGVAIDAAPIRGVPAFRLPPCGSRPSRCATRRTGSAQSR
jgi:non-heme chloroperoxidase